MIDEILKVEPTFNEGMFITKVNNIFIMLHSAIMMDDLDRVRHFISDDLEKKYELILKDLRDKNQRQMYDELNVKTTTINSFNVIDDTIVIKVDIVSRYMDYIVDRNSGKYISGVNGHRVEKMNHLTLVKKIGNSAYKKNRQCPTCGASIDVNSNGKCSFCHTIFNTEKYDWILESIETTY